MKNILVTGISKGLGLEITKILLENNYCVYGVARNKSEAINELECVWKDKLYFKSVDLVDTEHAKSKIFNDDFISFEIPLHGFINNAALAYDDIITNINLQKLETMFKINVFTPINLTKYAIRNMLLHGTKGSIVHLSSISVHTGYKGLAMYASSKGALEAFSKNTAREWGSKKIRSNCVVAGFMETSMSSTLTDNQKNRIYLRTSLKEATNTKSVANTVEFLLSEKSQSITGQNIFVDNGTI